MRNGDRLWTIDELASAVGEALAEGYDGAPNARVREIPDRRTIRYYTTLGLIDRPAEMRGRTALYGRRHLLQIVAIKKLQSAGRSLAEVQRELTGQTDRGLARIAGQDAEGEASAEGHRPRPGAERTFWREPPRDERTEAADVAQEPSEEEDRIGDVPQPLLGVPLGPGASLLLRIRRPIEPEELASIRVAAAPLIDLLIRSRLIEPVEGGGLP